MEGIKINEFGPDFLEISLCENSSVFPSLHFEFPIPPYPCVFLLSPAWLNFLSPGINDASYLYTIFYAFKMFSSDFWSSLWPVSCQDTSLTPNATQREMLPWRTVDLPEVLPWMNDSGRAGTQAACPCPFSHRAAYARLASSWSQRLDGWFCWLHSTEGLFFSHNLKFGAKPPKTDIAAS